MTQTFHTPIVNGDPRKNDAAIWNDPLGELDAQLGALNSADQVLQDAFDAIIIDDGTGNAEVIAARTAINYKAGTPPALLSATMGYAAGDLYNVKAYGALGNGSADDTTAIQAAIDAASAMGGGIVFVPRGTYKITLAGTACLTLADYVTLRGVGPKSILDFRGTDGGSAIDLSGKTDAAVESLLIQNLSTVSAEAAINSSSTTVRMRIRNVQIRGVSNAVTITNFATASNVATVTAPGHGYVSGDDVYTYGTGTTGVTNSLDTMFRNITVVNANTWTSGIASSQTSTTGVCQRTSWFDGINVKGSDALIEDCNIQIGFYVGVRLIQTARRAKVTRNYIALGFRGVMLDSLGGDGASYSLVSHNHFDQLKHMMSKIENTCYHNFVCDNMVTNCTTLAFCVATLEIAGPYTSCERNHFFWSTPPISTAAIDTIPSAGQIAIRNNSIQGHNGTVINLRSGALTTDVVGNVIVGGAVGISLTGAYLFVTGNRISDVTTNGIYVTNIDNFIIQNNMIRNVTASNSVLGGHGIHLDHSCAYGSIMGNIIQGIGGDGIFQGASETPGQYITMIGNVIVDVGNGGAGRNIQVTISATKVALVGNLCDDTPETYNILGAGLLSLVAIGNATQKGVSLAGTTVSQANNI
jgi:hypothetical protein